MDAIKVLFEKYFERQKKIKKNPSLCTEKMSEKIQTLVNVLFVMINIRRLFIIPYVKMY